jgi:hypothetical protein
LADGIAFVGIRSLANLITDYATDKIEIRFLDGGKLSLGGNVAELSYGTDAQISLDEKVGITNATQSLKTALDALITSLTGWVDTTSHTPNAATVTALNAVKTQFDALLK